jgi:hypothetical protein
VVSASSTPAASELRGVLRAMPEKERYETISKAMQSDDHAILHAVLGAHPIASGSDPIRHQMWSRQLREARHPDLVRRMNATKKAIEIVQRAAPAAMLQVEKAARFKFADMVKLKEKASASMAALAKLG